VTPPAPPLPAPAAPLRQPAAPGWHRAVEALSAYLPLVLMLLLTLATGWLVRQSPPPPAPPADPSARGEPDYTMARFTLERFHPEGHLVLRVEGERLRHFPDTDRLEIDAVRIRSIAPDGRITLAQARRAVGVGDGSELQLQGGARVDGTDAAGVPISIRSEFLHLFLKADRVQSNQRVEVERGAERLQAAGLLYDHAARRLELAGPLRAVLPPRR
jgi:lipopolysaccharide export system protein LptC